MLPEVLAAVWSEVQELQGHLPEEREVRKRPAETETIPEVLAKAVMVLVAVAVQTVAAAEVGMAAVPAINPEVTALGAVPEAVVHPTPIRNFAPMLFILRDIRKRPAMAGLL